MANAGDSRDYLLILKTIKTGKLLKIYNDDYYLDRWFKDMINKLVLDDQIKSYSYRGKKYEYHSAWHRATKLAIKINQIRQRKWYFKFLKE